MIRIDPAQLDLREFIRPGDAIVMGQGTSEPLTLTEALVRQRRELGGVRVFLGVMFSDTFDPAQCDGIELRGLGGVGTNRRLVKAGVLDVMTCHVSQVNEFIAGGEIGSDVALVQVSPPDEQGRYSLGLAADYTRAAVDKARVVIAEMNHLVPQSLCDGALVAGDIDVLIETRRAPIQLPSAPIGDLERRIAAHVDAYIPDRATLQVGYGSIPEAVIALPSAAKGGTLPKIVARLSGPVTTARSDVDVVATEHGAVRLRGMPLRHRVKAMIDLAAPQHREALERQAHEIYRL